MGFQYHLPTTLGNNASCRAFYDVKEALKTAGWTVASSGDGLAAFSAVGDVIVVRGDGAGGVNDRAWVRLVPHAGSTFEIILQAIAGFTAASITVITQRWKVSAAAGFTGGAPNATTAPSATDEFEIYGGGTDAAPTGEGSWNGQSNSTLDAAGEHLVVGVIEDQAPSRFCFGYVQDFSPFLCRGGLMIDQCQLNQVPINGLTDALPYVFYQAGLSILDRAPFGERELDEPASTEGPVARMTALDADYEACEIQPFMTADVYQDISGTNPFLAGAHDLTPMVVNVNTANANNGTKGGTTLIRYIAQSEPSGADQDQLYEVNGRPRSWLRLNNVAMAWGGAAVGTWADDRQAVNWGLVGDINVGGGRDANRFRMRATDTTLGREVYWFSQVADAAGNNYTGPGPLVGVTASLRVRDT